MLEQKDMDILRGILIETLDQRLSESENLILDELERTRGIMENKIACVQKNLEEL